MTNIIDSEAKLAEIEQRAEHGHIHCRSIDSDTLVLCATIRQLWERDRWIPVSEKVPEVEQDVRVWDAEWGRQYDARYFGGTNHAGLYDTDEASWACAGREPNHHITHWRPLPPPPETEEQP